jgi:transposase
MTGPFRKGQRYGALLVDLERRQPVDALPDREVQTLARWLSAHPGIEVISRDRMAAYAEGARLGAPQAVQVADRWHLLKNLAEALAASYDRHHRLLHQIEMEPKPSRLDKTVVHNAQLIMPPPVEKHRPTRPLTPQQQARQQRRAYWESKFQEVHTLRDQGLSRMAIKRQTGLCLQTVRKYCRLPALPKKTSPKPKAGPRLIVPFRPYLQERLLADPTVAIRQLWREIRDRGFTGGASTTYMEIVRLRHVLNLPLPHRAAKVPPPPRPVFLTARTLAILVLCQSHTLNEIQRQLIARARQLHPEIDQATQLALNFACMLRAHDPDRLEPWMQAVAQSVIPNLMGFASGLRSDYAAVQAAVSLPWSTGQVEGQINRLKLIKRQMYGRAKFDLLRLRVLHPT